MRTYKTVVTLLAIIPLLTGVLDLCLGVQAARTIGLILSSSDFSDALLNSEFRSFGTTWLGFGVLLMLSVTDLERYSIVAKTLFGLIFVAGLGRLLTIGQFGLPGTAVGSAFVLVTTVLEIGGPPLMILWQSALERRSPASQLDAAQ
jgi:hypothetical protein